MKKSELKRMIAEEVSRMTESAGSVRHDLRYIKEIIEEIAANPGTGPTALDFQNIMGHCKRALQRLADREKYQNPAK